MIEKEKMTQQNAIQLFEGKQVRMSWNEEDGKYIKRMRARDIELDSSRGTNCTPTEMTAIDGKKILATLSQTFTINFAEGWSYNWRILSRQK